MSLSDDLRDELAAIAPRRRCCSLAELSALFHSAGTWHLRGHGELAVHLDLASPSAARRAFTLLRGFGVDSEIRTYRRQAFDRATRYQLHVDVDSALRQRCCARRASLSAARGAARAAAEARRRPRVLPRRLPPRRTARRRLALRAPWGAPRAARRRPRRREASGRDRRAGGSPASRRSSAAPTPSPTRRAAETIADLLAVAGASETALRLDEHGVLAAHESRGQPPRKRRRGERQAHGQCRARAAGGDRAARARKTADQAARDREPAQEASVAFADRARSEVPPPDHEGSSPSPNGGAETASGDAGFTPASTTTKRVVRSPARNTSERSDEGHFVREGGPKGKLRG